MGQNPTTPSITKASDLEGSFAFVKYRSPLDETQPKVTVSRDAYWSYCGPLLHSLPNQDDPPLPANFYEFEAAAFTSSIIPSLLPLLDFVNTLLTSSGLSHYFLTIRATRPNHDFDKPRWHTDEIVFSDGSDTALPGTRLGLTLMRSKTQSLRCGMSGTDWKICATLLGPSTLFIPQEHQELAREQQKLQREAASTDHDCMSLRCVACASSADIVRQRLATDFAKSGQVTADLTECTVFRVGRDYGAIHSEPNMSANTDGRIFINILPGTEAELKKLVERWGMNFPRQWWLRGRAY